MARWKFTDVFETGDAPYTYEFHINPNEGGSIGAEKQLHIATSVGPNRRGVIQEGQMMAPQISFSGVILDQAQFETFERWLDKRILVEMEDDLGRKFRGVFSAFEPTRVHRPRNPWYHTYSASFTVLGYRNASGVDVYGRFA